MSSSVPSALRVRLRRAINDEEIQLEPLRFEPLTAARDAEVVRWAVQGSNLRPWD
jgi:hypothetical protein